MSPDGGMQLVLRRLPEWELLKERGFCWWRWAELIKAWLEFNNCFIGDYKTGWEMSYNSAYHFYDITLYADSDGKTHHFNKAVEIFKRDGYEVSTNATYRLIGSKQIPGIRIWVHPKKGSKHERLP